MKILYFYYGGNGEALHFGKHGKPVKRKQPKAQVKTLEKAAHLLLLERPQEVFDIMQSFLNGI